MWWQFALYALSATQMQLVFGLFLKIAFNVRVYTTTTQVAAVAAQLQPGSCHRLGEECLDSIGMVPLIAFRLRPFTLSFFASTAMMDSNRTYTMQVYRLRRDGLWASARGGPPGGRRGPPPPAGRAGARQARPPPPAARRRAWSSSL